MKTLSVPSGFLNSVVYVIDGLPTEDLQTARHLYEDLCDMGSLPFSPTIEYKRITSIGEFRNVLRNILQKVKSGLKPIIHFEVHADSKAGIAIGEDQAQMSWSELATLLREINIASGNHTGIVFASCYGLYAIKPLTILEPTPFFFLIGSEIKVEAGTIDDEMKKFYRSLFTHGSLDEAMRIINRKFQIFHAEKFFTAAILGYFRNQCRGKNKQKRIENLLSQMGILNPHRNRKELRAQRKYLRNGIKPNKSVFVKFSRLFLLNRVNVTYEEIAPFI